MRPNRPPGPTTTTVAAPPADLTTAVPLTVRQTFAGPEALAKFLSSTPRNTPDPEEVAHPYKAREQTMQRNKPANARRLADLDPFRLTMLQNFPFRDGERTLHVERRPAHDEVPPPPGRAALRARAITVCLV